MISVLLIAFDVLLGIVTFFIVRSVMIWRSEKKEESIEVIDTLNDRDEKILKAIREGKNSLSEIMKATGMPKSTVYKGLQRLLKEGKIEAIREGKVTKYVISEEKSK